jgi:hypothetical protein
VRSALLGYIYKKKGIPVQGASFEIAGREEGIRKFAELVEMYVDVPAIREIVGAVSRQ